MGEMRYRLGLGCHGEPTRIVREVLDEQGWAETGGLDWRLYWDLALPGDAELYRQAIPNRLMNHLWGIGALNEKGRLWQTLGAARRRLQTAGLDDLYGFVPRTFLMPDDAVAWRTAAAWNADLRWVRKPRGLSRGRGVALVESPAGEELGPEWLVQQYIDSPHLLDGYKYTLRFYVLIASLDPLLVYLYPDGFTKFASRPYQSGREHLANRFMHLTNPDVLKEDASMDVSSRNLTHRAYRERLRAENVDDEALWRRIRRMIVATVMAAREPILAAIAADGVKAEGCFELLGLDITLDSDLKPWLLECNASPSLQVEAAPVTASSRAEYELKQGVVRDTLALVGAFDPELSTAAAGSAEPALGRMQAMDARRGRFERLCPSPEAFELLPCLELLRDSDLPLLRHCLGSGQGAGPRLRPHGVHSWPMGDQLVLYAEREGEMTALNPTASFAWLACAGGLAPDAVAAELQTVLPAAAETIHQDVWQIVSDWVRRGLLRPEGTLARLAPAPAAAVAWRQSPLRRLGWNRERCYRVLGRRIAVRYPGEAVETWLHPTLAACEAPNESWLDAALEVIDCDGYHIAMPGGRSVTAAPGMIPALLHRELLRAACASWGAVLALRAEVVEAGGHAALLLDGGCFGEDGFFTEFQRLGGGIRRREPLLLLRDPMRMVCRAGLETGIGEPGPELPLDSLLSRRARRDGDALETLAPAEALMRLLAADPEAMLLLDPHSAGELVAWAASLRCGEVSRSARVAAALAHAFLTGSRVASAPAQVGA